MTEGYNSMLTEKGTVDRTIEIEDRMTEIALMLGKKESLWQIATALGLSPISIEQRIEELESELSDLQKEYRG